LASRLDTTIASTLQEPPGEDRYTTLIGLVGIRVALFQASAPYEPLEQRRVAA